MRVAVKSLLSDGGHDVRMVGMPDASKVRPKSRVKPLLVDDIPGPVVQGGILPCALRGDRGCVEHAAGVGAFEEEVNAVQALIAHHREEIAAARIEGLSVLCIRIVAQPAYR